MVPINDKSARWIAAAVTAILLAIFAATSWLSWRNTSATFDEPLHLVASRVQTELGDFRCDTENPPLLKYYLAIGIPPGQIPLDTHAPEWSAMLDRQNSSQDYSDHMLYDSPGLNADALIRAGRARMLVLGVLLGAMIAFWAWQLSGPFAAIVAAAFFCLDPNFLAHSALIKNDVPIALLLTALMYALWRLGRRAGILNCLAVGGLLGAAIATKYSGLLGIPLLAAALFARSLIPVDWPIFRWTARTFRPRLLAVAAIGLWAILFSYAIVWASYGFRYEPAQGVSANLDGAEQIYAFDQSAALHNANLNTPRQQMNEWLVEWRPDTLVQTVEWIDQHHLLPETFSRGFLSVQGDSYGRPAYLCGEISFQGWWYYFPLAMLFKTPLATLIALALSILFCAIPPAPRNLWIISSLAVLPILYMLSAMHTGLNLGIRHILPVYPFLFILIAVTAARAVHRFKKPALAVIAILFLGLAVETFAAFPNFIPFFNIAAGGYRGGAALLSDSNIDWGQNLPALAAWQRGHPQYQMLLAYYGSADPRYYGIHYVQLPETFAPRDEDRSATRRPCWALSVIALQGQNLDARGRDYYQPFRDLPPSAILGGSIYIFTP